MLHTIQTYLKAIGQSFYNPPLYTQVVQGTAKPWQGYGLAYALVLSAVLALVNVGLMGMMFQQFGQKTLPALAAQVPDITVTKGEVSVHVPQPHIIKLDKEPLIVINTKASVAEAKTSTAPVFVTKDTIYLLKNKKNREAKFIDKTINVKFDGQTILKFWHTLMPFGLIILWPLMTLGGWFMLLVQGMLVAVGSYIITAFMPEEFEFGHRLRMAVVALTPPLLLQLLVAVANLAGGNFVQLHLNGLTVVGVALVYFYAMLRVARHQAA